MDAKNLLHQERKILEFLVAHSNIAKKNGIQEWMAACECETLSYGDMGSFRLIHLATASSQAKFSYTGGEAEFTDTDGVTVLVCLTISEDDYLFEIDFWKANFASLVNYPQPQDVKFG